MENLRNGFIPNCERDLSIQDEGWKIRRPFKEVSKPPRAKRAAVAKSAPTEVKGRNSNVCGFLTLKIGRGGEGLFRDGKTRHVYVNASLVIYTARHKNLTNAGAATRKTRTT